MKTLSEVWREYSSKNPDLKWNTFRSYGNAVGNLIAAVGDKAIDKIDQSDIEDFKVWLYQDGRKPGGIESSMKNARPVFTWAMNRKKYINSDPFREVKKPKVPRKEIRIYDEAELYAMLCSADIVWQTIIVAAASAGLRKGEILNLRWDDVNFEEGYILVQAHEKTKDCWPWEPKSWECRQVPLSEQLKELFERRRKMMPPEQPYINLKADRYAELNRRRQPDKDGRQRELKPRIRYTPNENFKPFRTILRRAKIDDGRTFHDLRSTAITGWLYAGLLPHEVQKLAGHEHIETTMKYYVFCKNDIVQRAKLTIGATGLEPATS